MQDLSSEWCAINSPDYLNTIMSWLVDGCLLTSFFNSSIFFGISADELIS